ncbi:MAG: Exodeoxyribonuclease 7 small subunit [Chlamydiales bacterium]|nr:Exodeoxyribonuclease 7 small subunit [Chlamydiales bacterium]
MATDINFEQAFARLEAILERMNSGNVSLDDSLKLYEEADQLISGCGARLTTAQQKIEALIKKRDGSLELDESAQPKTAPFEPHEDS